MITKEGNTLFIPEWLERISKNCEQKEDYECPFNDFKSSKKLGMSPVEKHIVEVHPDNIRKFFNGKTQTVLDSFEQ